MNFQILNLTNSKIFQDISMKLTPFSFIFKELSNDTKYMYIEDGLGKAYGSPNHDPKYFLSGFVVPYKTYSLSGRLQWAFMVAPCIIHSQWATGRVPISNTVACHQYLFLGVGVTSQATRVSSSRHYHTQHIARFFIHVRNPIQTQIILNVHQNGRITKFIMQHIETTSLLFWWAWTLCSKGLMRKWTWQLLKLDTPIDSLATINLWHQ